MMRKDSYVGLIIKGELWVAYPLGWKMPLNLCGKYPFRGKGLFSYVVYILNRLYLDRVLFQKIQQWNGVELSKFKELGSVALFWPSKRRSNSRFYGYKTVSGRVVEYLKIATSDFEKALILKESRNAELARTLSGGAYRVPNVLGVCNVATATIVRYEALPEDVRPVPVSQNWIERVTFAREQIFKNGYVHGDFGWHNLKLSQGDLWILDWEELRKSENPLIDEVYMDISLAIYWRHESFKSYSDVYIRKYFSNPRLKVLSESAIDDMIARGIEIGHRFKRLY